MPHQFETGAFFHGQPAWHRLGHVVAGTMPARDAFALASADWSVISTPVFDPTGQPIEGYRAISRSDNGRTLSIQKDSYTTVQNEQLIRLAEALHEDAEISAVCVLDEGRKVTFTARILGAEGQIGRDDEIHQYIVGATSHDGSISFQTLFTPIRVVCANTLSAALGHADRSGATGKGKRISIRHTLNCNAMIERLPEIIDVKRQQFTAGLEELKAMASKPCSTAEFKLYCEALFADQLSGVINDKRGDKTTARPKTLADLSQWETISANFNGQGIGFDLPGVSGTYWGAYNAVTQWVTHESGRGSDVEAARRRLESQWWGAGQAIITKAHSLALVA